MKIFKKYIYLGILMFFAFLVFLVSSENKETYAIDERGQESKVILATVEDEIKAGTFQYLKRVIRTAEEERADYIIIKLDTPGGLLKATEDIVDLILETEITTIVFVNKEGGWAYSAGIFILMAADLAVVHPRASIGAAQPVVMGASEAVAQKLIESMASWMRTLAVANQRNPEIAERFVRENLTLTGYRAKELGVINETAENLDQLFLEINILNPRITRIYPSFIDRLFNFLSHPALISLFLTIGTLAIIMAIRSGEICITGAIGAISLMIGFWGMGVITFSSLGIGLLLVGFSLLLLELFIEPGFGLFGIAGTIAVVLGIFTFGAEPFFIPEIFDPIIMMVMGAALTFCIFFIIVGRAVAKTIKSKPRTGIESLIDLESEVTKELNPRGFIKINQEVWSAISINKEIIRKGVKVKIIKIKGNTVFVEKVDPGSRAKLTTGQENKK